MSLPEYIEQKIDRTPSGCWIWTGAIEANGYGASFNPTTHRKEGAHRVIYKLLVGPVPKGLVVHHKCRVRACVNPAHLCLLTPYDHTMTHDSPARRNSEKTHCPKGHSYAEHGSWRTGKHGRQRECRECKRVWKRRWDDKNREHNAAYKRAWNLQAGVWLAHAARREPPGPQPWHGRAAHTTEETR